MNYADTKCTYTEQYTNGQHTYTFTGPCVITKKQHSVVVKGPELYAYRRGAKMQDAMRSVNSSDREFLMTGISPEGWDRIFGKGKKENDNAR